MDNNRKIKLKESFKIHNIRLMDIPEETKNRGERIIIYLPNGGRVSRMKLPTECPALCALCEIQNFGDREDSKSFPKVLVIVKF